MANRKYLDYVKKHGLACLTFAITSVTADQPQAILGGTQAGAMNFYAGLLFSDLTTAIPVTLPSSTPSVDQIFSVSMNRSGLAILGGRNNGNDPYAAILPSGQTTATQVTLPGFVGQSYIRSVSISNSGRAILGGTTNSANNAYALVLPADQTTATQITLSGILPAGSYISSVSINSSDQAIIGGVHNSSNDAYAAILPAGQTTATQVTLSGILAPSEINSVSINSTGRAILSGRHNSTDGYVSVLPSGQTTATLVTLSGIGTNAYINSVSINDSDQAIIGGLDNTAAYAAILPAGQTTATNISLPGSVGGEIVSVAINNSGRAILGGKGTVGLAYAAILPSGQTTATEVTLPGLLGTGTINSVAINSSGHAIVVGNDSGVGYAALLPFGQTTAIPISGLGGTTDIYSVSMALFDLPKLLEQIPTAGLSGNNLIFANYINTFSPSQAFYFIPAEIDGTLASALESAVPTRNAFAAWSVCQNLFHLSGILSNRSVARQRPQPRKTTSLTHANINTEELTASNDTTKMLSKKTSKALNQPLQKEKRYELWISLLGSDAFQKKQNQTPAFNPLAAAAIAAFDAKISPSFRIGAGAAYTYTHIHEKQGAGHSNINQENVFLYSLWHGNHFYLDTALWGGLVQIENTRKIKMTSFNFESKSKPHGWNLMPHIEIGYTQLFNSWGLEPFLMLDWAAYWQNSYKESGSGPFNAGQHHTFGSMLRTELSSRFFQSFPYTNWTVSLQEKIGYVNKTPFQVGRVTAFLVGSPGSFTVETLTQAQNLGLAQFGFIIKPNNPTVPTTTLSYQGEFGSIYQSHTVSVEIFWNF